MKALRDGSAASEQPQLTAALAGAAAVGQQLVLTAVNGAPIEDLEGMGWFRAGLEAVKKAKRPVTLRLLLAAPPPVAQPLQPEPEPEPEQVAVQAEGDEDGERSPGGTRRPQIGDRGAAATTKTRNALLGGLRSGTLEGTSCCLLQAARYMSPASLAPSCSQANSTTCSLRRRLQDGG